MYVFFGAFQVLLDMHLFVQIAAECMAMQAPPLHVVTHLTTEEVQGSRRNGKGTRLDPNGFSRSGVRCELCTIAVLCHLHVADIASFLQACWMCYSAKDRFLANRQIFDVAR